jgi:hypothetical protein
VHCRHPGFCWHDYPNESDGIRAWSFFERLDLTFLKCQSCGEMFVDIGARGVVCYDCFVTRHGGCQHPLICWERQFGRGEELFEVTDGGAGLVLISDGGWDLIRGHARRTGLSGTGVVECALREFTRRARVADNEAVMRELDLDPEGAARREDLAQSKDRQRWLEGPAPWTAVDDAAAHAIESVGGRVSYSESALAMLEEQGYRQRLSMGALIAIAVREYVERAGQV